MFEFTLNGLNVRLDADQNLLEYLREDANITSVKNGCSDGVCGSCSVLVNGRAVRACTLTASKVHGKEVVTLEGLSQANHDVFTWAFGKSGAVQCGYCIPGAVISARSLLNETSTPTRDQIRAALRFNLCRCTGYKKIEQGIELAAAALRTHLLEDEGSGISSGVGARSVRIDAADKVLGSGEYVDDMKVPNMLHAAVLRSPCPRALIRSIDTSAAKAAPGVIAVLTAADVPGQRLLGHIVHDWPVMVEPGEETRYVGDALALVAAESKSAARDALALIQVDHVALPPLLSAAAALAPDAPQLHPGGNVLSRTILKRGDADQAIAASAYVVTHTYSTPRQEHAFLEPESALAVPGENGQLTVYTGAQGVFDDHRGIVEMLGVADDAVRVVSKYVGGGFGGKEDLSVQHHAALLAWHTARPVKLTFSREESLLVHPKRHPMEMTFTTACDEAGKITAVKATIIADTGAYASLGGPVLQRACTHAAGPYQIENVDIHGRAIYTNNIPSGAFRGFGVVQTAFAMESNLNLLAQKTGLTPWEIRFRNAIEPGGVLSNGQIAGPDTALKETLLAVKDVIDAHPNAGVACAFKNSGKGVGVHDVGRVRLKVADGSVVICTSAACMGQGLGTALRQIVSETAGLPEAWITLHAPDTAITPDSGTSTASRQTLVTGEAARRAAMALRVALERGDINSLTGEEFYGEYDCITDPMNSTKTNPVSHVAYGYATQVVVLDDAGRVQKIVAAHDVGRAINPNGIEGQIEGGVVMGMGFALTEYFQTQNGSPSFKFGTLGLLRSTQVPEIECRIVEKPGSPLAYGAKGVGEIVMIPTAPAISGAYLQRDRRIRTSLPLPATPYSRRTSETGA